MTKDIEFTALAEKISKEITFCKMDGALYYLEGNGIYRSVDSDKFINLISKFDEGLTPKTLENLVKAVKIIKAGDDLIDKTAKPNLCPFSNGVFDFESRLIYPYMSKMAFTSRVEREIVIDAPEVEDVDKFLDDVTGNDKLTRKLLLEVAGMCFYRSNRLRKSVVLVGPARSGKSTFLDLLVAAVGQNNISTLDPTDLSATFSTEQLVGKMVNAADDINVGYLKETGALKRIISGGLCLAQKKFKDAFTFRPFAKMIFTSNKMPKMNDPNGGMDDRLIIIPFTQCFRDDNCDYKLIDKLTTPAGLAYFTWISIKAFCDVLDNGGKFSEPKSVSEEKAAWRLEQDSVLSFANEFISCAQDIVGKETSEVYTDYTTWMKDNGLTGVVSKKKMQDSLVSFYGGVRVTQKRKDKYGGTGFFFAEADTDQDTNTNAQGGATNDLNNSTVVNANESNTNGAMAQDNAINDISDVVDTTSQDAGNDLKESLDDLFDDDPSELEGYDDNGNKRFFDYDTAPF